MTPDWKLLAGLTGDDLQMALLTEADAILEGEPGPEEDRLLLTMPEPLRAMWIINWLDYEVCQGSLLAYFFNSHGRHAPLAAALLRRISAHRMADVVAKATASYERTSAEDLSQLTDRYWQAAKDDNWCSKLDAYLGEQVRLLAG